MTTQAELDQDLLAVLEQHLTTRRELLKRVKGELANVPCWGDECNMSDIIKVMNRLINEAKLPGSK